MLRTLMSLALAIAAMPQPAWSSVAVAGRVAGRVAAVPSLAVALPLSTLSGLGVAPQLNSPAALAPLALPTASPTAPNAEAAAEPSSRPNPGAAAEPSSRPNPGAAAEPSSRPNPGAAAPILNKVLTAAVLNNSSLHAPQANRPAAHPAQLVPAAPNSGAARPSARRASVSRAGLDAAAETAAQVAAAPSSLAHDARRIDFSQGARGGAAPVVAALGTRLISNGLFVAEPPRVGGRETQAEPPAPKKKLWPFIAGTFANQTANNALQATMPMLLLAISESVGPFALAVAGTSIMDSLGTITGGWLADRWSPKRMLVASTIARTAALAGIPTLLLTGGLSVPAAMALFLADAFARGVADTARHTIPIALVGKNKAALSKLNATHQMAFDGGALFGPLSLFAFLALGSTFGAPAMFSEVGHFLVPLGFVAASMLYGLLPRTEMVQSSGKPADNRRGDTLQKIFKNKVMWLSFITVLALTLYPLRSVLPGLFGEFLVGNQELTPLFVGLFGVGGVIGSWIYAKIHGDGGASKWLLAAAAGTAALALSILPGSMLVLGAGLVLFAATNVGARIAMYTQLQHAAPEGLGGRVMGTTRFAVNLAAFGIKTAVSALFVAVAVPQYAFWFLAAGLGAFALALVALAGRFRGLALAALLPAATAHGLPGRLIVVEGLDGSGKSTQMDMVREYLEKQGVEVVLTTANSSQLMADAVKRAKKTRGLTPQTFSLTQATDVADRIDHVIVPALRRGAVVLSDRYIYTGLARDKARGMRRKWLRTLYAFAPKPDLTLYFRLPVETAVGRVLKRSEGPRLSENFDEDPGTPVTGSPRVKYYEGGLDMELSEDPVENFRLFQSNVQAEYDKMAPEFGLEIIDAARGIEEQHALVLPRVLQALGDLDQYAQSAPKGENIFDKDPAGDSEKLRQNYKKRKRGLEFYFRNMFNLMQERFEQLVPHDGMPKVFLHGNAHLDNYVRTLQGVAMADFDRARVGPYAWEFARMMVALSVVQKNPNGHLLHPAVLSAMRRGYLQGFRDPEKRYQEMRALAELEPSADESTVKAYMQAGKKWAVEMRENSVPVTDAKVRSLLDGYLASRGEQYLLETYDVAEAGRGFGSMGERDRVLVLLKPKREFKDGRDWILIDLKEVRDDGDGKWYKNPFAGEIARMHGAADLYAPGWSRGLGSAVYDGVVYEGRHVPTFNVKLKRLLSVDEQEDFAYAVGTQLGRSHRLSLQDGAAPEDLEAHLRENWNKIVDAAWTMRREIAAAHRRYLIKLAEREGEPGA